MRVLHRIAGVASLRLGIFGSMVQGNTAGKVSVAVVSTLIALVANLDKVLGRDQ